MCLSCWLAAPRRCRWTQRHGLTQLQMAEAAATHQMPPRLQVPSLPVKLRAIQQGDKAPPVDWACAMLLKPEAGQLSSLAPAVGWACRLPIKLVAAQLRWLVPTADWACAQPGRRLQLIRCQPRLCAGLWQPCSQQPSWHWPRALPQLAWSGSCWTYLSSA